MTALQKLESRAIDVRKQLRDFATAEGELDADKVQELRSELDGIETRQQALIAAGEGEPEPEPDAETREMRSLIDGANLGLILDASLEKRNVDGETAELQAHFGLAPNQVPLDLLRRSDVDALETRDVTTAPTNTGRTTAEIIQPVFAAGAAAFLDIPTPRVPNGDRVYPVLTTRPTVGGPHTDSTAVSETTGSFNADALAPSRIQASFFYRRTDAARFGSMDASLRDALSSALMEAHDYQILRGAAGLFTGTNLANNAASGIDTFATYVSRLGFGRVDGRFATSLADLKVLVGAETYGHLGTVYSNPVYDNAANVLSNKLAGLRVTAHAPTPASSKQNCIVRRGMRRDAVSPIWEGVTLIPDEVTQASKGEIRITAVMLFAMKILRADGFVKIEAQHA